MVHVPGHHNRGMEANGPVVPAGGGYQERDATKSTLDPDKAAALASDTQLRTKILMLEREREIDAGLEHLTPAEQMKRSR